MARGTRARSNASRSRNADHDGQNDRTGRRVFLLHSDDWACGKAAYIRFHGTKGKYRGRYTPAQIARWSEWLRDQQRQGRSCWAYFNNDIGGDAIEDALALKKQLET